MIDGYYHPSIVGLDQPARRGFSFVQCNMQLSRYAHGRGQLLHTGSGLTHTPQLMACGLTGRCPRGVITIYTGRGGR
nr:MAG TPA: hypothetical protein [Caudoviricetes sp.]